MGFRTRAGLYQRRVPIHRTPARARDQHLRAAKSLIAEFLGSVVHFVLEDQPAADSIYLLAASISDTAGREPDPRYVKGVSHSRAPRKTPRTPESLSQPQLRSQSQRPQSLKGRGTGTVGPRVLESHGTGLGRDWDLGRAPVVHAQSTVRSPSAPP